MNSANCWVSDATSQANERFNQTLQQQLLKYISEDRTDLDLYLDSILFSYRISHQDPTKFSPFELVHGRKPKLPINLEMNPTADENDENEDGDEFEGILKKSMLEMRETALINIEKAQEKQKLYYDAKHCKDVAKYSIGAKVLLRNNKKDSERGRSWSQPGLVLTTSIRIQAKERIS